VEQEVHRRQEEHQYQAQEQVHSLLEAQGLVEMVAVAAVVEAGGEGAAAMVNERAAEEVVHTFPL